MGDPTVSNDLALCKLHHSDFDGHILGVRPDLNVEIREDILREKDVRFSSTASKASRAPKSSSRRAETFSQTATSQPALFMNDSGRRSDLFRRCGVSAPLRCALASPSSRFLASAKNLCRGQVAFGAFRFRHRESSIALGRGPVFRLGAHE